jgi:predicted ATPase/tetratricopeptide (TPR) repeat protein/DNA-binding SARP family transcriptional activator
MPIDRPVSLAFYLLLRGDWVQRSELVYLYYPDTEERLAQSNFRKLIHRLKKHPWAATLETEITRLRLTLSTDVADFRLAIAQKDFAKAIALHHGTLLDGVQFPDLAGFEAWLELERQEVKRAYRQALLRQAQDYNQQYAHSQAEDLLRQAWQHDPSDEEVVQALLRTLQAAQQPSRAIQVLSEFRQHLQEFGAVPLESTLGLVQTQNIKPHNLPQPNTRFVGRKRELVQVATQLQNHDCRLLCVVGLGGVGKTRFALEVVRQQLDQFPDGVWFVPLVGIESAQLLVSALAAAVGLQFSGSSRLEIQLQNFLRHKKALLLLDNFEQLQAHGTLLEQILFAAPDLKILVTSRVVVGLADEWLFDLTGLSYPPLHTEQALEDFEAVQLFMGQVARRSSGFIADNSTLPAIARFCRNVQGLPLALELAAAWTRSLGVRELLHRLESQLIPINLFEDSHQDPFLRQRNLHAILEYTFGLLSPPELAVFQRLSVFAGSFSLEAAEAVSKAHLGHLLHFINLALLQRNLEGRFELHELVRQFAEQQLEPATQQAVISQKTAFFIEFLVQQNKNLHSSISPETLVQCKLELGHVIEALEYTLGAAVADEAWLGFLSLIEGLGLFELGQQAVQRWLESDVQPQLLALQAYFAVKLGDDLTAQNSAKACLERQTSPIFHGIAHITLGIVAHFAAQYDVAQLEYQQALEIFSTATNISQMARVHNRLGVVYDNLNQPEHAHQHYQTALELAQAVGDLTEMGLIYNNHGIVFESLGETQKAKAMYTQALEVCQHIGYLRGSSAALTNLGHLCERNHEYGAAKTYYEQSLEQKKIIGEPIPLAISQTNLADVLYQLGETNRANAINLQTLEMTLKSNALMYTARVVWSVCKHLVGKHRPAAIRLAHFLSQHHNSEQWVQAEAKEFLKQLGEMPASSNLEFSDLLEWLTNSNLLDL